MEKPVTSRSDPESRKAYTRWHYQQNKEKYKARARASTVRARDRIRALIARYLAEHPCIDCGESDPIVLEFDHRDPAEKSFNLGDAVRMAYSERRVQDEIDKCDVRCANCHRRKTYYDRIAMQDGAVVSSSVS